MTFHFTAGDVLGVRGAAVSTDEGKNWAWLGADSVQRPAGQPVSFDYSFPGEAAEVYLAFCPLYTQANLDEFLRERHTGGFVGNALRRDVLCRSRDGRDVELLRLESPAAPYRLLLTKMPALRTRVTDFAYQELARQGLPIFRTVMVERVAYREMFLTGFPPDPTSGAGLEVAALATEMEEIVKSSKTQAPPRIVVGQGAKL